MIEPDAPLPILFPESSSSDAASPILPIEQSIVSAALNAQEAKQKADWVLFTLRNHPRNRTSVETAFREAQEALTASWLAYVNYVQIFDCKGQA